CDSLEPSAYHKTPHVNLGRRPKGVVTTATMPHSKEPLRPKSQDIQQGRCDPLQSVLQDTRAQLGATASRIITTYTSHLNRLHLRRPDGSIPPSDSHRPFPFRSRESLATRTCCHLVCLRCKAGWLTRPTTHCKAVSARSFAGLGIQEVTQSAAWPPQESD